jgi:FixJ family two-component response regulator
MQNPPTPGIPVIVLVIADEEVRESARILAISLRCHPLGFGSAGELLADGAWEGADGLVVEQHLPDMSGLELLARLRRSDYTAAAILIPSRNIGELVERASALGPLDVMEGALLAPALARLLNRCRASSQPQ